MLDIRDCRIRFRRRALVLAALGIFACDGMFAQSTTKPPTFDVASVRPNLTGVNGSSISGSGGAGGRITLENASLKECIFFAFDIPWGRDYELSGPVWLDEEKFDIAATFPPGTPRDRIHEMMRTLLADRFSLKIRYENRKLEAYVLVLGKRGPKLEPGSTGTDGAFIWGDGKLTARAISMSGLADRLSGPVFKLDRPVVDMTGIKGVYDFILKWSPDDAPVSASSSASIFTALQEQLGLKLETRKISARTVVIEHLEKVSTGN
jgi:uncharacterized protein (TIGR03435 family)